MYSKTSRCRDDNDEPCQRRRIGLSIISLLFLLCSTAIAQLSGGYTVGGVAADYPTIESALIDLTTAGVSGPVTFYLNDGIYSPSSTGYVFPPVSGMSPVNTVTWKPAPGASPVIAGTTTFGTGIITITGSNYIIDGTSNPSENRDLTIRQTGTYAGFALLIKGNADNNIIENCILQSNNGGTSSWSLIGGAIVMIGRSGNNGSCDSNIIRRCLIGDPDGTWRCGIGVHLEGGGSQTMNVGNQLLHNQIVNWGRNAYGSPMAGNGYGIFVDHYNSGTIVRANTLYMTSPSPYYRSFGIFVDEGLGLSHNVTIDRNRIYGMRHDGSAEGEIIYGIFYQGAFASYTAPTISNNMISMSRNGASTQFFGIYLNTFHGNYVDAGIYHNSVYAEGSGNEACLLYEYSYRATASTFRHKNNIYLSKWESSGHGLYVYPADGWISDHNLIDIDTTAASTIDYDGSSEKSLASYQAASGQDGGSVSGDPRFIDAAGGDLHIDRVPVTPVEGMGEPIASVTADYDGIARNMTAPDIGADEGDFNGGAVELLYPNGGERILAEGGLSVQFRTGRPIGVAIQLSLDDGATWADMGTVQTTDVGDNSFTFDLPDTVTTRAKVKVVSLLNEFEKDSSDLSFSLIRPVLTLVTPNGGNKFYEFDPVEITWTSTDMPDNGRVKLEYSVDGGATWDQIATDLPSLNLPYVNQYTWIIPSVITDNALVRVSRVDKPTADISDAAFSIEKTITLLSPDGTTPLYAGDRTFIRWNAVRTNYLHIEYSIDGGINWSDIIPSIPAYLDSLEWVVPDVSTSVALIRLSNRERPEFTRQSDRPLHILQSHITLLSPVGGERYEQSYPVTVSWTSRNTETIRIDYSSNNGATWNSVADNVAANSGSYTFVPAAIPTKLAMVRLVNVDRPRIQCRSDHPFEIMEPRTIGVLVPGTGDQLIRRSSTVICWYAPRIPSVDIFYSSDGGNSWSSIAYGVLGEHGSFAWRVPDELTERGKISIRETNGSVIGESGIFSVIDQKVPVLTVISPNGGEVYTEGDMIPIRWNASPDIVNVAIYYWAGSEGSWRLIAANVPANQAEYLWKAPAPGNAYQIKVESYTMNDLSDGYFRIVKKLQPNITVIYPNGGEELKVGTKEMIRWEETDLPPGTVTVYYSTDMEMGGWQEIATVATGVKQYDWTVPNNITDRGLVLVESGAIGDASDDYFTISFEPIAPIVVTSPNGGETWTENEWHAITWTGPADISQVQLFYSTDLGSNWNLIGSSSSIAGANSFLWRIPAIVPAANNRALVKIASISDASRFDLSDNPFTLRPSSLGVPGGELATASRLTLLGNYPNPFSASTELRWIQPRAGDVEVRIYASDGRGVLQMEAGHREGGQQGLILQKGILSSGVYFYEIRCGNETARGTMSILH